MALTVSSEEARVWNSPCQKGRVLHLVPCPWQTRDMLVQLALGVVTKVWLSANVFSRACWSRSLVQIKLTNDYLVSRVAVLF